MTVPIYDRTSKRTFTSCVSCVHNWIKGSGSCENKSCSCLSDFEIDRTCRMYDRSTGRAVFERVGMKEQQYFTKFETLKYRMLITDKGKIVTGFYYLPIMSSHGIRCNDITQLEEHSIETIRFARINSKLIVEFD
jgi:hypothetical protein